MHETNKFNYHLWLTERVPIKRIAGRENGDGGSCTIDTSFKFRRRYCEIHNNWPNIHYLWKNFPRLITSTSVTELRLEMQPPWGYPLTYIDGGRGWNTKYQCLGNEGKTLIFLSSKPCPTKSSRVWSKAGGGSGAPPPPKYTKLHRKYYYTSIII